MRIFTKSLHRHLAATALLASTAFSPMFAEIVTINTDDYRVLVDTEKKTACMDWFLKAPYNHEGGAVTLPDTWEYEGQQYPITSIGYHACINNSGLTKLVVGKYVTYIAEEACMGSSKLTSVSLPEGLKVIGTNAFGSCTILDSIPMPASLDTIGDLAFMGTALKEAAIPANVKYVGINPWRSCTQFKSVTIPASNAYYKTENNVLYSKDGSLLITLPAGNGLTEFTVPSTVKEIGAHSIRNNPTLAKLNISEGVESVGEYAMAVLNALPSITLPASLKQMGPAVFWKCPILKEINVASGSKYLKANDGLLLSADGKVLYASVLRDGAYTLPDGLEIIEMSVFNGFTGLTSLKCPNSLKEIRRAALGSTGLKSVELGNSLQFIGFGAFQSSTLLESIELPATIRTLDNQAFCYCSGLQSITIPEGLDSIGGMAFYGCSVLPEIVIPGTVQKWGTSIFYNCGSLSSATFNEGVKTVPGSCFNWCGTLRTVKLPSTLVEIGDNAFNQCKGLTRLDLPSSVRKIGYAAFQTTAIRSIEIPEGVESVEEYCFASMPQLTTLSVPTTCKVIKKVGIHNDAVLTNLKLQDGLEEIGEKALSLNGSIKAYEIPKTVTRYGEFSINYCLEMTDLYVYNPVPAVCEYDFYDPETWKFLGYEVVKLHVPQGTKEAYQKAAFWSKFQQISDDITDGVDTLDADTEIVSTRYYDFSGVAIAQPEEGKMCIRQTVYSNGKVKTEKIVK